MKFIKATRRAAQLAAVAAALFAFGPAAHSQTPSAAAVAEAKRLIAVTDATAMFKPLVAGVIEQAKLLFLQQNPALGKDINEIAAKMRTDLAPRLHEVDDEVAKLYATAFTEQELKAIVVFYESPVGKKLLSRQPSVISNSMQFAQNWANKLSDKVIAEMRVELKKRGHNL